MKWPISSAVKSETTIPGGVCMADIATASIATIPFRALNRRQHKELLEPTMIRWVCNTLSTGHVSGMRIDFICPALRWVSFY